MNRTPHNSDQRVVHIRFEGRSQDIPLSDVDMGGISSDQDFRRAVARYLDVSEKRFASYVVERHPNGNMTVRPQAVFG